MLEAERKNLTLVKALISNENLQLELWEDEKGNLFVSSSSCSPEGIVYYATTPSLFCKFLEDKINLQTLFDKSPSLFVEIYNTCKTALYSMKDIEIKLKSGDKTMKQLIGSTPFEVWTSSIWK